jgi:hypothetical protein
MPTEQHALILAFLIPNRKGRNVHARVFSGGGNDSGRIPNAFLVGPCRREGLSGLATPVPPGNGRLVGDEGLLANDLAPLAHVGAPARDGDNWGSWVLLVHVDERSIGICLVLDQHLGDLIVPSSWGTKVESTAGAGNALLSGGAGRDETTLELDVQN